MASSGAKIAEVSDNTTGGNLIKEAVPTGKINSMADSSTFDGKNYIKTQSYSKYLGLTIDYYTSENILFKALSSFKLWFTLFTVFIFILIFFFSTAIYRIVQRPILKLMKAFGEVDRKSLDLRISRKNNDEFSYLYTQFNKMLEDIKTLIDQVYTQKILAQSSELKHLQSQINVHFLYNTYYLLNRILKSGDVENATHLSRLMGDYFQFITRNASENIRLEAEVRHARTYATIQAIRFMGRIKVEFGEIPVGYEDLIVPRLILQPILENAFEAGLKNKVTDGLVNVKFCIDNEMLVISVADNGDELSEEFLNNIVLSLEDKKDVETTGTINIHRRLKFTKGLESGLSFCRADIGGLEVRIEIKL